MSYFLSETFLKNDDEYHPYPITGPLVHARCASCGYVLGITDAEFILREFFYNMRSHNCKMTPILRRFEQGIMSSIVDELLRERQGDFS
jgi:hypothetical protein